MTTGNNLSTADAVSRKLCIDEIHAKVLPEGKANIVKTLQEQGKIIPMRMNDEKLHTYYTYIP